MRNIFIKYNPYRVTTEITIDDKPVKKNSRLNVPGQRLQEWVDYLPDILFEECNTREFEITFHGTALDFEDIAAVAKEAEKKNIYIKVKHIPAKEVKDKEKAIDAIFADIRKGPFDELRQNDVIKAFEMAKSSDFEVNVVATMSAGKSTLINALLGDKLMPAKQEACTATITEIHDNDAEGFEAEVYDSKSNLIERHQNLTYEIMDRLNSSDKVSKIKIYGNIPFVESDDESLVLIDTPGPNNSRDPEHRVTTYNMLSESSKTLVLYILNAQQLGVDDDDNLLNHVSESMKVGGKQSRDRFIFVINKMDEYWRDEDSVESAIGKVRNYLADKGIENPNIYPASAITALWIRDTLKNIEDMSSDDDGETEIEEAKKLVRRMVKKDKLHFETYAPLSAMTRGGIENRLAELTRANDKKGLALIHSGIVPIEEAIKMYVIKYAKTAKIKNIVDTFAKKLESQKTFENAIAAISTNEEAKEKIIKRIDFIEAKLESGEKAKQFKDVIMKINYDKEITEQTNKIIQEVESEITKYLRNHVKEEMTEAEAERVWRKLTQQAENLNAKMIAELENIVNHTVKQNASDLLDRYKEKLSELVEDMGVGNTDAFQIDPFKMMEGRISDLEDVDSLIEEAKAVKQSYEVVGHHKKYHELFGFRRWLGFNVSYDLVDDYDYVDKEYISGEKLSNQFIVPIQAQLYKNRDMVVSYTKQEIEEIKNIFFGQFRKLDEILGQKFKELKECASNKTTAEEKLEEAQKKLKWLEDIQNRIDQILDI